jgi:hypothetical protein
MTENIAENDLDRQVLEDCLSSNHGGGAAAPAQTSDFRGF